jgi:hypothetical protein
MYVFGIVVAGSDETPIGRASAALRTQLPAIFPEHAFEFLGPKELTAVEPREAEELLFHVLAAEARSMNNDEALSEIASPDLVQTIQAAVDEIVSTTKNRNLN